MSELQASILPEKQVFVLDQNGYYSVTSTVSDKNKSKEPGFTQSSSGKPFIGSKQVKVEFDVKNGIRDLTDHDKAIFQSIVKLIDESGKDAEIERILLDNPEFFNTYNRGGIDSRKDAIIDLGKDFQNYFSAISIKDPNMVDVYVPRNYNNNKYIPNAESSAFFYKRKEPITFLQGKVHPFKIYLVIDGNDINIVAIYKYVRGSRYERPTGIIKIGEDEFFTITTKLPDFDRENTLILINYKEEIEFYLSHAEYIKLVDDPSKKDMYDSKPTVFYQRKKASQLASEEASGLVSKLKEDEEYLKLAKEYKDDNEKLIAEYKYPYGKSKQDPEFKAITTLINVLNTEVERRHSEEGSESGSDEIENMQELLFKPTYIDKEFEYWQVFENANSYKRFLYEQYAEIKDGRETRTMSKSLKTDYDKIKTIAQSAYTKQKRSEEEKLAVREKKINDAKRKASQGEERELRVKKKSLKRSNGGGSKNKTRKLYPP